MDLFDVISNDIKEAMKAKDKVKLETLRNVKKFFLEAKTAPQNSLVLITPNRKKGTASFLLLLRLLSRLLPFRYMLLRNQEKYQKEQSDKPTRQQIYRLRARLPLIFRKSFWLLGLQQQLLLFC